MAEKRANNRLSVANITSGSSYLWPPWWKYHAFSMLDEHLTHTNRSTSRRKDFNRGSPPITECRAVSRNKERPSIREREQLYLHQAATLIYTVVILKARSERIAFEKSKKGDVRGSFLSFSLGHGSQKSLYLCAVRRTGQCTCYRPPSVDKMPKSPLDWPSRVLE